MENNRNRTWTDEPAVQGGAAGLAVIALYELGVYGYRYFFGKTKTKKVVVVSKAGPKRNRSIHKVKETA